ncbi:MAG TPA: acetyl-CoA carboxylase biotin carboxyl carrier protein subunit [Bacteroidales bacterium]|nr:acetyl-CoA carboxylase biotin carboxyl carrier protein subunit [Bacteroidales bacterium]HOX76668.1 acetyl-CoA carboxylase biotin carboxyl carrier protein subunit [Bacteroidales bacterium]HPM92355.1 acetyl-CoA carboxylase biotin carboxyl carrier protein subunit [Bacteroidales bacterium]
MTEHKHKQADENSQQPQYGSMLLDDFTYQTIITEKFRNRKPYEPEDPKKIFAFIPGKIRKVHIKKGSKVKEGEILLVLEAMKMNNNIFSPLKGVIKEVYVTPGLSVAKGTLLAEFR